MALGPYTLVLIGFARWAFRLSVYAAILLGATWAFADDPWADSPYKGWAEQQQVMESAKKRMQCTPGGSCSCCNQAEIVKTKFRPVYNSDDWEWWDNHNKIWKVVPRDIINWDTPTPDGQAVLFLWPPQYGEPRCFYPPSRTAQ